MRVLFLGTPAFASVVLGHLHRSGHTVVGVVTQPPRPSGRGLSVVDPPAARSARDAGLPVFHPVKLHAADSLEALRALEPDLIVTAAFGRILRPRLLQLPPRGCWNVHASLLPRHRGAAPVTASLLSGDAWTGVTIFRLDEGMDTGPLLLQEMTATDPRETAGELTERLADLGGRALVRALDRAESATGLPERPQPQHGVTYTRLLEKDDGNVLWSRPADQVDRQVRAVTPWPGAFTFRGDTRLRIHRAVPVDLMPHEEPPGLVLEVSERVVVACRPGALALEEVQTEGRKRQAAAEWVRGARLAPGERLTASSHV